MDSVSRGELPDTLHLPFHLAEFDVFIQARQANYKSAADLTTSLTPSTANCPKIKTGHPARGSSKRSRLLTALVQIYQPGAILHARGRFNDICVFGPPQWVFRSIYHGHAMLLMEKPRKRIQRTQRFFIRCCTERQPQSDTGKPLVILG